MIAILTFADLQSRTGNSLRPIMEAEGLVKNGFNYFVVYSPNPSENNRFEQKEINIRKMKDFPLPLQKRKFKENLIHAHQLTAGILNQKYILDMHGFIREEKKNAKGLGHILSYAPIRLEEKLIRNAETIICATESIKQDILKHFRNLDLQIDVVRNMVKPEDYVKTEQKGLVVGVIGPFTNRWGRENIKMLYEMLRVGKIDYEIRTVGKIDEYQLRLFKSFDNVKHLGVVSDLEYKNFLKEISVLVLPFPPQCFGGGSKNKLLEAAASSIPVVSTPAGVVGFDEKEAVLIGENSKELIEKIKELESFYLRKKLGNKLREIIEFNYNYKIEAEKLINIYEGLTK